MKTSLRFLFLVSALLSTIVLQAATVDDSATSSQATSSSGSTNNSGGNATQAQRTERFKQALAQLGLTDSQKTQIKQIRTSVTNRKERRAEILNVLTPDQKSKLRELIKERRNGAQTGADNSSMTNEN